MSGGPEQHLARLSGLAGRCFVRFLSGFLTFWEFCCLFSVVSGYRWSLPSSGTSLADLGGNVLSRRLAFGVVSERFSLGFVKFSDCFLPF